MKWEEEYTDRGANAPRDLMRLPRKHSLGRFFAAWVWPGGAAP